MLFMQYLKAPVTQSRFRPRFTMIHPELSQMVKSGCIRCVRMEKRISSINTVPHDAPTVSTDPLRLMTAALRFTTVELRMLMISTVQYGASMIQAGSATVAPQPPMNVHDLVVVMRQSQVCVCVEGVLSFFHHT